MKKKIVSLAVILLIGASLTGCGEVSAVTGNQSNNQQTNNTVSKDRNSSNENNTATDSTNVKGVVNGETMEIEKLGDTFLEKAYDYRNYDSESYSGIAIASYNKQALKIQREILEQEKQQTELLKKIEANTRK